MAFCCRPACPSSIFHTWETLLQEVEIDSQALGDIGSILGRQVSRPLLERSFHRKIQSRKVFTHRDSYEAIMAKTEEKLAKVRWCVDIAATSCRWFKKNRLFRSNNHTFLCVVIFQCRQDYKSAYLTYLTAPTTESLSAYFNSHNAYVQQLHATNGMLDEYGKDTLPALLQVNY